MMILDTLLCFDLLLLMLLASKYSTRQQYFFQRNLLGMIRSALFVFSVIPFMWHLSRKTIRFWTFFRILIDILLFYWTLSTLYFPVYVMLSLEISRTKDNEILKRKKIEFFCCLGGVFLHFSSSLMIFYIFYKRLIKLKMVKKRELKESVQRERD